MRFLLRLIGVVTFAIVSISLHLSVVYLFSPPWSKINIIFLFLLLYLLWSNTSGVVWMTALVHVFLEFLSLFPFGVLLFSSTLSMVCSYWFFHSLFVNRSWHAALVLTGITLFFFRGLYIFGIIMFDSDQIRSENFWIHFLQSVGWEMLLTTVCMGVIYFIGTKFSRRLNAFVLR